MSAHAIQGGSTTLPPNPPTPPSFFITTLKIIGVTVVIFATCMAVVGLIVPPLLPLTVVGILIDCFVIPLLFCLPSGSRPFHQSATHIPPFQPPGHFGGAPRPYFPSGRHRVGPSQNYPPSHNGASQPFTTAPIFNHNAGPMPRYTANSPSSKGQNVQSHASGIPSASQAAQSPFVFPTNSSASTPRYTANSPSSKGQNVQRHSAGSSSRSYAPSPAASGSSSSRPIPKYTGNSPSSKSQNFRGNQPPENPDANNKRKRKYY